MSEKNSTLSFSLFDIERAIAQNEYTKFENYLSAFFEFVEHRNNIESVLHTDSDGKTVCSHKGLVPFSSQMTFNEKQDLYSRLAASISAYLSSNHYTPPNEFLVRFVIYKTHVTNIFYLSCYGNMDHILFNKNLLDETLSLKLKTEQDIKLLYACLSLNSRLQYDTEQIVNAISSWGMYWYLGLLYGHHRSFNDQIASNYSKIIDSHSLIQTMDFDATSVELACSPWMICSYLDIENRHEIKKSINIAIEKWLGKKISPGNIKQVSNYISKTTDIKHIAIFSEKYSSFHAMYRCYHNAIVELKKHYKLTLVSSQSDYDSISAKDFDNIIHVEDEAEDINNSIIKISKLKPDLILYTSLGMAKWTIPLSNLRLARYQMMCYGHPASAFSKVIDYGVAAAFPVGPDYQEFLQEKLIMTGTTTQMKKVIGYTQNTEEKHDDIVRIAVNSSLPKISQRFINLCILIKNHSSLTVEFHFFLIQKNIFFEKSIYGQMGASAVFHQPKPYNEYMATLSQCDLAIGTFPFGGSNTNVDLALLGIPKLIYTEHSGLASYSDLGISKQLGLPETLFTTSEAELLTSAIYLIHDSVERERLAKLIKEKDLDELVFKESVGENDSMLTDALSYVKDDITKAHVNSRNL
jgi:hypothetical protein